MYFVVFTNNVTHAVNIVKAFKDFDEAVEFCSARGYRTTIRYITHYVAPNGSYVIKST